jgi:hypothetical protein
MSYLAQAQLANDPTWNARCQACAAEQAQVPEVGGADAQAQACADAVLRAQLEVLSAFTRLNAAGPGIADKAGSDGSINQALVEDAEILALTQQNWPVVSSLYFDADGTPL